MKKWRLISLEDKEDSYYKMASEEAIMSSVRDKSSLPTLRFYSWNKPAVSLGFFQEAKKELNLEECSKNNIEIFRRITGGGAVYKSPLYEINYSLIIREDDFCIPKDVEKSYALICSGIIAGLRKLGFETTFKPVNDILLNNKKISGNAQTRVDNVILHHGTILLKPECEIMFKYLKIDDKKLLEKKVKSAKDLVCGLYDYKTIPKEKIISAIVQGFEEIFNINFMTSSLTEKEKFMTKELYSKYSDKKFIFWR
ncbi:lipoate--protein ligase family protein [archaeon]|nr:lipoate--protein ligase family protein [archaeon]NCP79286.1 lipoate--protein ligase family protein [archaeon]NCP98255.1 lipoate--protein ligase family protein [archaeon]NCQ07053.1 lipoate--protein ligase family protein [archaeon]NCQ50849.1 lipoate--protein ligase family protein [archaeon]